VFGRPAWLPSAPFHPCVHAHSPHPAPSSICPMHQTVCPYAAALVASLYASVGRPATRVRVASLLRCVLRAGTGLLEQGLYGSTAGMNRESCTGLCSAGRFGNASGLVTMDCSAVCPAGGCTLPALGSPTPPSPHTQVACVCTNPRPSSRELLPLAVCNSGTSRAWGWACVLLVSFLEPGYFCPAGTNSSTMSTCPSGQYSLAGATTCSPCPPGRFGDVRGLTTSSCSGPCAPGRYGDVDGLTGDQCVGPCQPGYFCPPGSVSPNAAAAMCPVGRFSTGGAPSCSPCPRVGACSPRVCLRGRRVRAPHGPPPPPTPHTLCIPACPLRGREACRGGMWVGWWAGVRACGCLCGQGRFGNVTAMGNASCSGLCQAGRYGGFEGLSSPTCTAACLAGELITPGALPLLVTGRTAVPRCGGPAPRTAAIAPCAVWAV
jgi:hypothetical protein